MTYENLRKSWNRYYNEESVPRTTEHQKKVYAHMDEWVKTHADADAYTMKAKLYEAIAAYAEPVFLEEMPFFGEMGTMAAFGDGESNRGCLHANGWLIQRNYHLAWEQDPKEWEIFQHQVSEQLYLVCGPYFDTEHFGIPMQKMFTVGLSGVYRECEEALAKCETEEETAFVRCAMAGLTAVRTMQLKFAKAAGERCRTAGTPEEAAFYRRMADAAERVPWLPPESVYEGLCLFTFTRKAIGSLEGVGFNSFGRIDKLLGPLYERDMAAGVSEESIYDDICKFMLLWDCHIDRRKKMEGYADYEYENTLVIGGCDDEGKPLYNPITRMTITSQMELACIYPKITCRYGADFPAEYLELIGRPVLAGQGILLYQNDDATIPALVKQGYALEDAREYLISGCWDLELPELTKTDGGAYVNCLKTLEWTIYQPQDKLQACALPMVPLENTDDFEAVYRKVLRNILTVIREKTGRNARGGGPAKDIYPVCVYSALTKNCLKNRKDFSAGGSGYPWEVFCLSGIVDVIDSLLAIRHACFEKKLCTLPELLDACRQNWADQRLHQIVLHAPHYGDTDPASTALMARMIEDIYNATRDLPMLYGGTCAMGCYNYTEIIGWGQNIAATPNGRVNGDYMTHGLTPSRLHEISSVTDVASTMAGLPMELFGANTIINTLLPADTMTSALFSGFLRSLAVSGVQALQANVVSKEELLAAQREPERYGHILVRVCGFSAPFVSLSERWQEEFLTRNFYKS